MTDCKKPPDGWRCSRIAGHDGPCAASPQAAPVPVEGEGRRFRGVGHLEETGYIPSGSATERDGITCIQDDATDQQLREWSERHGLDGVLSCYDLRAAFEDAQSLCLITPPSQPAVELEQLSEPDKDVAIAQAVELAEYVERQAKGEMVKAAQRFLSLPYAQEIAARLALIDGAKAGKGEGHE